MALLHSPPPPTTLVPLTKQINIQDVHRQHQRKTLNCNFTLAVATTAIILSELGFISNDTIRQTGETTSGWSEMLSAITVKNTFHKPSLCSAEESIANHWEFGFCYRALSNQPLITSLSICQGKIKQLPPKNPEIHWQNHLIQCIYSAHFTYWIDVNKCQLKDQTREIIVSK